MTRPLFVLNFGAWASGLSGGDRHLLEVGARWRDEVDVEALAPPAAHEPIQGFLGDVRFHYVGRSGPRVRAQGPALAVEYVRRAFEAWRHAPLADVAVAASHFIPDAAALAGATGRGAYGVAYVYHLMSDRRDRSLRTFWSKTDERVSLALIRRSTGTIFTSNSATAAALGRCGIESTHTDVGLDLSAFRLGDPLSAPPTALFVSRLVSKKGLPDAVEAWASVAKELPEARLVVAGTGPEREPAERRARELGIAHLVSWRGFVNESEKRDLLASSRLLLAPSYEEGWGIAVAEALASTLPVVAYRLPTLDEIFGEGYSAVPLGDTRALAEAVVRTLRDDGVAASLSQAGRRVVERYDIDRVAEMELRTILAALDKARLARRGSANAPSHTACRKRSSRNQNE